MKNIKQRILDFYNSLSKKNKMVIVAFIVLFLAIIYYLFVKNNYRAEEINYKKMDINNVISKSTIIYNRTTLLELQDILEKIFDVQCGRMTVNNKVITLKQLYDNAIPYNYSKALSYNKFKKKINDISTKITLDFENIINIVYYYGDYDMYLVKLNTNNLEDVYIGIKIFQSTSNYSIIYIE